MEQLALPQVTVLPPNRNGHAQVIGKIVDIMAATSGSLRMPRTVPNPTGGELVAIFEQGPMPENCQKVIVIDPATCDENFSCAILNNQGLGNWVRTVTWLPDGRVAGVGQTAPNRQGRCVSTGTVVAFPAIDPNGTSVTTLTTGTNPEGAGGG